MPGKSQKTPLHIYPARQATQEMLDYSENALFSPNREDLLGYIDGKLHTSDHLKAVIFPVRLDSQHDCDAPVTIIGYGRHLEDLSDVAQRLEAASRAGKPIVWPVEPVKFAVPKDNPLYRLVALPYVQGEPRTD